MIFYYQQILNIEKTVCSGGDFMVMGKYFEDFEVGEEFTTPGRTITETDIVNFAGITGDWNQLHTNKETVKEGIFEERIAHGMLILSILTGLFARLGIIEETALAFYGIDKLRFTSPTFIQDTIHGKAKIIEKDEKEKGGLVTIEMKAINQNGEQLLTCQSKMLMKKKPE